MGSVTGSGAIASEPGATSGPGAAVPGTAVSGTDAVGSGMKRLHAAQNLTPAWFCSPQWGHCTRASVVPHVCDHRFGVV